MRKYVYHNATVYISKPTEAQIQNIRESTKRFLTRLAKKGLINNGNENTSVNFHEE